jgi:hypothetical protein
MDLLVTTDIAAQVAIGFRFYAITDVYTSSRASTVVFNVNRVLSAGGFLRLAYNTTTHIGMKLLFRPPYSDVDSWVEVAYSSSAIGLLNYSGASCLVFYSPSFQSLVGICALTFVRVVRGPGDEDDPITTIGTPPPSCVVPCQFAIEVEYVDYVESPPIVFVHAESILPAGAWINQWQLLKWGPSGTRWRTAVASNSYEEVAAFQQDLAQLVLQPGQLTPVAYRPYEVENGAFGGQWVLVATKPIPAHTTVYIGVNEWREEVCDMNPGQSLAYVWTSPLCLCLAPGTVVDLTGLGTAFVHASVGTLRLGPDAPGTSTSHPEPIFAYTAYCGRDFSGPEDPLPVVPEPVPVTGTYPCSYRGSIPRCLVLGRDLLALPWPDCPSLLPTSPCHRVTNWPCEQLALNNGCPSLWTTQPVPAFKPDATECCRTCCCTTPRPAAGGGMHGCTTCRR